MNYYLVSIFKVKYMLIYSQYSSEHKVIPFLNCARLHHPVNVILPFLWSNYYGTGLVWLLFPLQVSLRLFLSWKKMPRINYGHQVCQLHSPCRIHLLTLILTLSSPLPQKSWRDLLTVHTLLRLLTSEPREWLQWLPKRPNLGKKMASPSCAHKLSKLPTDADGC